MSPPIPTAGRQSPIAGVQGWIEEPPTPIEVPQTDHELLVHVARNVRELRPIVAAIAEAMPTLMTKEECMRQRVIDHPGPRAWMRDLLLVAGVLGALAAGWQWLMLPAVERAERAALAAAYPREPRERVVQDVVTVDVPQPIPVGADATAAPKQPATRRAARRP